MQTKRKRQGKQTGRYKDNRETKKGQTDRDWAKHIQIQGNLMQRDRAYIQMKIGKNKKPS